jgi:malate synthase
MEDAATAEISRSQIWQWVRHGRVSRERVLELEREELEKLGPGYEAAAEIFAEVALADEFTEFLTLPAYERPWPPRRVRLPAEASDPTNGVLGLSSC